jgi:hypothetical protein
VQRVLAAALPSRSWHAGAPTTGKGWSAPGPAADALPGGWAGVRTGEGIFISRGDIWLMAEAHLRLGRSLAELVAARNRTLAQPPRGVRPGMAAAGVFAISGRSLEPGLPAGPC